MARRTNRGLNKRQRLWIAEKVLTPLGLALIGGVLLQVFTPGQTIDALRATVAIGAAFVALLIALRMQREEGDNDDPHPA